MLIGLRLLTTRSAEELGFLIGYGFLYLATFQVAIVWSAENPRERHLLRVEGFTIQSRARGLLFGIALVLLLAFVLILIARPAPRAGDWQDKLRVGIDQVLIVAIVEEFLFRWVGPKAIDWAGTRRSKLVAVLAMQALFAFAHEPVRESWLHFQFTPLSVAFFFYAFSVGLLLWLVIQLRDNRALMRLKIGRIHANELFGFGTAVGIHGTLNAVLVIWDLRVAEVTLEPLAIGAWVLVLAIAAALVPLLRSSGSWRWRRSASSSSSSYSRSGPACRSRSARTRTRRATTSAWTLRPSRSSSAATGSSGTWTPTP